MNYEYSEIVYWIKNDKNRSKPCYINFRYDSPFIQGAWWISFPPRVIPVWMNQSNSTIELTSSAQPEIRQGRVALYMKSGRGEMYSIYLIFFVNSIRFGWTKILIQITRKASRKSDIDKIAFIQNHPNCQKLITNC